MPSSKTPHAADIYAGNRLRHMRIIRGLSQTELGQKIGLSFQQIQKYESGQNRVSLSRATEISKVLDMDPCDFFADTQTQAATLDRKSAKLVNLYQSISDPDLQEKLFSVVQSIANSQTDIAQT